MTQLSDFTELKIINVGSLPDDGTGDNLRAAFVKTNDNFNLFKTKFVNLLMGLSAPPSEPLQPIEELQRAFRDQRLRELDQIVMNPLRYAEFSEEYKQRLSDYRSLLLDVPQQAGFPETIIWPDLPQQR